MEYCSCAPPTRHPQGQGQADHHRRSGPAYTPGQWVWLSTKNLSLRLLCKKLNPRYVGPFKIIRQITPVSVSLPSNYRISPTFHVSLLKPAGCPRGERDQEEAVNESSPPINMDGEEAYQVQEILDSRRRLLQYLIDWEGYGSEERSWVNAQDILDPSLTAEFHRDHPHKPAPHSRVPLMHLLASGAARRGGGLCHESGLCGSLRSPPKGHPLLSTSVHTPRTWDWLLEQVFPLSFPI